MIEHVSICEVGPRDGLQIAKTRMTTDAKVGWIKAIAAAPSQKAAAWQPAFASGKKK